MVKTVLLLGFLVALLLTQGPAALVGATPAQAQQATDQAAGQVTGLPLPRFVSLRSGEVNMRSGPGLRYPIRWIYRRAGLPIEVIAESDTWRKLRDWEGAEGWVHQSMLTGERTVMVTGGAVFILDDPNPDSATVAQLEEGVIAALRDCEGEWCRVSAGGYSGWLLRADVYGVYPSETIE